MKLIPRRKKSPTTFEQITGVVKLGAKGLAVQRVARKAFRRYKFTRRAVPLAGLAALGALIAKKARGGGGGGDTTTSYTPPAPSTGTSAGTTATAAATAATGTPPADDTTTAGPEVSDAPADAGVDGDATDAPKEAAAPGVGDESTSSGEEPSASSGEEPSSAAGASDTSPPGDASGTEDALDVEGPNQSTPPPPESTPTSS